MVDDSTFNSKIDIKSLKIIYAFNATWSLMDVIKLSKFSSVSKYSMPRHIIQIY